MGRIKLDCEIIFNTKKHMLYTIPIHYLEFAILVISIYRH